MIKSDPRYAARTNRHFARASEIEGEPIRTVEDKALEGDRLPVVKTIICTDKFLCTEVTRPMGIIDPPHQHADHESIFYLIKGRVRLVIGKEEFIAEAGDYWVHPVGVEHYTEMLEESVNIEVKIPPVKTWNHPDVLEKLKIKR
jgi:quercetin dioxygenase-like cupin family protein